MRADEHVLDATSLDAAGLSQRRVVQRGVQVVDLTDVVDVRVSGQTGGVHAGRVAHHLVLVSEHGGVSDGLAVADQLMRGKANGKLQIT